MAEIAWWIFRGVASIWILASSSLCLYWAFSPNGRFWWTHRRLTWVIVIGGFLFCCIATMLAVRHFLWFIPDGWTYKTDDGEIKAIRLAVASTIGVFAALALAGLFHRVCKEKWDKERGERIRCHIHALKFQIHANFGGDRVLAFFRFIEKKQVLDTLAREGKIAPWQEEELEALMQVLSEIDEEEVADDD